MAQVVEYLPNKHKPLSGVGRGREKGGGKEKGRKMIPIWHVETPDFC
jgi:hypothetical protein